MGTQDTIDLSLAAQEIGVDVLSIITPYFAALSRRSCTATMRILPPR